MIKNEFGESAVNLWLLPVKPLYIENNSFKLEIPNSLFYNTIKDRFESKIIGYLKKLTNIDYTIAYSVSLHAPAEAEHVIQEKSVQPVSNLKALHPLFNPDYTFETFVVGPSNRFAYAAAQGFVSNGQSTFFIYSAPGLGKTHLLHAIAHGIYKKNNNARILYTASENFVNEYIRAVSGKTEGADAFRNKYRNIDCLLLDDVQFLLGKERSEEEFFYTFNALVDSKKQIVLTSDRPPRELAMVDRMISRFLQGTVADIKLPDFETRVAILRQKRDQRAYDIPDDVITFIAENVKKNVRELEGCLITIGNFCINMGIKPSIDGVREIIKDHITTPQDDIPINVETIKKIVADRFSIEIKDIVSVKKTSNIALPRQIAMYLCTVLTDLTLQSIGDAFNKDHATIMHAKKKIEEKIKEDPWFNEDINKMISKIKNVNNSIENA